MIPLQRPAFAPARPVPSLEETDLQLRPTAVEVDLGALAHNLKEARRLVGPEVKVLAVVKADAYGHGAVPCARAFVGAGAAWLGVAIVEEGVELRRAGLVAPICVLSGLAGNEAGVLVQHRLTPIVYRPDQLAAVASAVRDAGLSRYGVHLKVDTGMGRYGVLPEDAGAFLDAFATHPALELEGLATHFGSADQGDDEAIRSQREKFEAVAQTLAARGLQPSLRHLANSACLLDHPETHADLVRPGLMLYGHAPAARLARRADLKPALTFRTRIAHLKSVPAGFPVSYGATYVTPRPSRLATLPVGYADGLPRAVSNRAELLVRGQRAPLVGRVCMDACLLDVTNVSGASLGDEVVIIGRQGALAVEAEELAVHADTISYEILCGIGKRVPRVYR